MKRFLPLLAVLLGVLPALAAPVPKAIKRDPLLGEWRVADGQPACSSCCGTVHTLYVQPGVLWWGGVLGDTDPQPWEVEEDGDGERFLVIEDRGRRHPFTLAGDTLTIRDRLWQDAVVLKRP